MELIDRITPEVIRKTYQSLGYPFFTNGDFNLNLGIIRSENRKADLFDDVAYIVYKDSRYFGNEFQIFKCWATADPGRDHLVNPQFPEAKIGGTAIVAEGFYRGLYSLGWYHGTKALIPVKPMAVYRDKNRDDMLDLDPKTIQWGNWGTLWHDHLQALDKALRVGRSSAGCFNMQTRKDHERFMSICESGINRWKTPISLAVVAERSLVL
jgi:hypothetical protein